MFKSKNGADRGERFIMYRVAPTKTPTVKSGEKMEHKRSCLAGSQSSDSGILEDMCNKGWED